MRYKINHDKILEIFKRYCYPFELINNSLVDEVHRDIVLDLTELHIDQIKIGNTTEVNPYMGLKEKAARNVLHMHFDKCFEELEPKSDWEGFKKLLDDNGFKIVRSKE